jgi:predicted transcriptional regulator
MGLRVLLKNRCRSDIWYLILDAAKPGEKKTRIMFKAGCSGRQVTTSIESLVEKGLLDFIEGPMRYITTKKGIEFMEAYERLATHGGLSKITR